MNPFENIAQVLKTLGWHTDAGETAFVQRQLEQILKKTYDVLYPDFKLRSFVPMGENINPGAKSFTYYQWDIHGSAKLITDWAGDLPRVDAFIKEFTAKPYSFGTVYGYSLEDITAAQMAGTGLEATKAKAARRSCEKAIDDYGSVGDAQLGTTGFINNANVPVVDRIVGDWDTSTTSAEMLQDLRALCQAPTVNSEELFPVTDLILDPESYELANNKPISDLAPDKTVLKTFLENHDTLKAIHKWSKLSTADAEGTGPRWIAYHKSDEVLTLNPSIEFEALPPQPKNLAFEVPCRVKTGGVSIRYAFGMAYMDPHVSP